MRIKMKTMLSLATISAGLFTGIAGADQWCLTYDGYGSNVKVGLSFDASKLWNSATRTSFSGVNVGEHKFHDGSLNYSTFCVQLFEGVTPGETVCFDVVGVANVPDAPPAPGPMGAIAATLVHDLYWRFYNTVIDTAQAAADRDRNCSAFGIALYEITHENFVAGDAATAASQANLFAGAFQANANNSKTAANDAVSLADQMLAALGLGGFHYFGAGLQGLTNPTRQDQLIVVPVPAVAGLGLAGLAIGGVLRRRFSKKA
ncbi:MAG: hypothetical protein SGJ09_13085 [Phycisphaerae bacterium]|nr:hypothetical protein [Phycisphaerae bacterium]